MHPKAPANKTNLASRKAQNVGIRRKPMKFVDVTQWVKVPPNKSLANRLVVNPAGKSGNGSPKPGGARVQAV